MMGRLKHDQGQLFYSFCLEDVVPSDHRVREIAAVLDLSWVHGELAPYYSNLGRPSIDLALMIRMLILGYVFAIRSERLLCREVQVNLAYRWFCRLGGCICYPGCSYRRDGSHDADHGNGQAGQHARVAQAAALLELRERGPSQESGDQPAQVTSDRNVGHAQREDDIDQQGEPKPALPDRYTASAGDRDQGAGKAYGKGCFHPAIVAGGAPAAITLQVSHDGAAGLRRTTQPNMISKIGTSVFEIRA